MWAGGRFEFGEPLRVGDQAIRESRIADIKEKQGRSGPLVFVVVRHEIRGPRGTAVVEEHDIVYRGHGEGPAPAVVEERAEWEREVLADDVLLFRYSALTFNGHRIHYDRRYCVEQEGYPGLVVHGPLMATLLLDLVRNNAPEVEIARFEFRAEAPLFDTEPFRVCGTRDGDRVNLWAVNRQNHRAMRAVAEIRRAAAR
jgi:3-methylfumaryl-CoA hydratase